MIVTPSHTPRPTVGFTTIADVNATSVPAPKRKGKEREASRHTYATPTPVPAGFEEPTEGVTMNNFGGFPDEDPADERAAFDDDPEGKLVIPRVGAEHVGPR
ncbi:hypothetical protein C8Q76DRAFT_790716 [Earliella scabrosa]|nr:hypothetical protein C8Q76DRAFT_790716 [Earliella scabrosa]